MSHTHTHARTHKLLQDFNVLLDIIIDALSCSDISIGIVGL